MADASGVLRVGSDEDAAIHQRHQRPVSLIGWSLGGIYAREIAKEVPERTRCVITLGTPFTGNPQATHACRFYRMVSGQQTHDESLSRQIREAPPLPTTSIYSHTDGIVASQSSVKLPSPLTENIEIHASHVGMGFNPLALYIIPDRWAQNSESWKHFEAAGARRWFFRTRAAHAEAIA